MIPIRRYLPGFAAVIVLNIIGSAWAVDGEAGPPDEPHAANDALVLAGDLLKAGKMSEAETVLKNHLAEAPENGNARSLLATVISELGRPVEAQAVFEDLIARNVQNHIMLNNYAWMLATTDDPAVRDPGKAVRLAQEAILLDPNNYSIWSTLAEAHYAGGNFDRAVRIMTECLHIVIEQKLSDDIIQKYRQQLAKLREAAMVMRLIE